MVKLYPIPETVEKCRHFSIMVNGQSAEAYSCTVSAVPFNRCWPGYQRPIDQTEEASFVYFDTDESVSIELEACKDFSDLKIRPLSKNIKATVSNRKISFSAGVGHYTVELDGHHNALHIFINPIKEYTIDKDSSDVLYFAPGVHNPGLIELKSGQTVFIDGGAVVHGSVYSSDADNIKIIGRGIIDNSTYERFTYRPMDLKRCRNVEVEGIIFKDSNEWTLTAMNCDNLIIDNAKAIGMWRYNADGFDICNSSNAIIRNCFLRTFDDGIVFKGVKIVYNGENLGFDLRNVENHLVENCVLWCDWGKALELGAETCADEYFNITYRNCDIIHADSVALDIQNGDRAYIHDVKYEDINVEYSKYSTGGMIQESDEQKYTPGKEPHIPQLIHAEIFDCVWSQDKQRGRIEGVKYKNITVYADEGLKLPPMAFKGFSAEHSVKDIEIENIVINGKHYCDKSDFEFEENEFANNIKLK